MNYLGKCNVQYANNLLQSKNLVLRADRERGDNPYVEIYSIDNESKLLLRIKNNFSIENMNSSPNAGNKARTDVYFSDIHLDGLLEVLEPFLNTIKVEFDDSPRTTPDPTGREHSEGIPLGKIFSEYSTNIKVDAIARYGDLSFEIKSNTVLYIDLELKRGKRFHMGINMTNVILDTDNKINAIEILIKYVDLKRFVYSIKIAKKILAQH